MAHGYRSDHDVQILASTIRLQATEEKVTLQVFDFRPPSGIFIEMN